MNKLGTLNHFSSTSITGSRTQPNAAARKPSFVSILIWSIRHISHQHNHWIFRTFSPPSPPKSSSRSPLCLQIVTTFAETRLRFLSAAMNHSNHEMPDQPSSHDQVSNTDITGLGGGNSVQSEQNGFNPWSEFASTYLSQFPHLAWNEQALGGWIAGSCKVIAKFYKPY